MLGTLPFPPKFRTKGKNYLKFLFSQFPSSIDIEVIKTVLIIIFFYERYFKHLKHTQKHLK